MQTVPAYVLVFETTLVMSDGSLTKLVGPFATMALATLWHGQHHPDRPAAIDAIAVPIPAPPA